MHSQMEQRTALQNEMCIRDRDMQHSRVLKKTDTCTMWQVHDRFAGMEYVECWGQFVKVIAKYINLITCPALISGIKIQIRHLL